MSSNEDPIKVTVSNRTIIRVLAIILLSYLFLRFVIRIDHILELFFISLFLAIAVNPAVRWIAKSLKIKSRIFATGIAYVAVMAVVIAFFVVVLPPLVRQTINYAENLPKNISSLENPNTGAGRFIKRYNLKKEINNISQDVKERTGNLSGPAISTAARIGNFLTSTLIVFVLTFMMLVEGPSLMKRYWNLRFGTYEWHQELAQKMYKIISGYVNGQVVLALIGGAFALVSLVIVTSILHVSVNSVALAGIIVFTGLIPMIGHIIGDVVVIMACLFVSWPLALIMAIILIVYLQIENVTLQPYVQARFNELTPLLVFMAALVGFAGGGLLGAFVAIPLAGCIKVACKEYLVHRKLVRV